MSLFKNPPHTTTAINDPPTPDARTIVGVCAYFFLGLFFARGASSLYLAQPRTIFEKKMRVLFIKLLCVVYRALYTTVVLIVSHPNTDF